MSAADANIPAYVRLAIAGLAGAGASFASHPFDLIKYRMQLSGKGSKTKDFKTSLHALHHVMKKEGVSAVYNGLSASIFRQLTLTMIRMGMYSVIVDNLTAADGTPPPILYQILAGIASGGVAGFVGNPADISLVRMASDGASPPEARRNYKHVFDAIKRIQKEEKLQGLWIGWKPSALRCMILNLSQIVLYKNTKMFLLDTGHFTDNTPLHIVCSVWTALASSFATAPIDIAKTRLMTMKEPEYTGVLDVTMKIVKAEGPLALWKGVTPTFGRILPNNFVVFILLEFLTKSYKEIVLGDKSGSGF